MATAADKRRWDDLHAALAAVDAKKNEYELELGVKYGHYFDRSWLARGQRAKLEQLEDRAGKIGDKITDLLVRVSPRGEAWLSGVPAWWIKHELTWEDAIRPKGEPLSVVVPMSYGNTRPLTERAMPKNRMMDRMRDAVKLNPPLVVTMTSYDGEHEITATAISYRLPDSDHAYPWVESWSAEDENGDEPDYRSDEEEEQGELLDAALLQLLSDEAREELEATIDERGNGFPGVGDYVPGDDGELYEVIETIGQIQTGGFGSGQANWIRALVRLADWKDVEEEDVFPARAIVGSDDEEENDDGNG